MALHITIGGVEVKNGDYLFLTDAQKPMKIDATQTKDLQTIIIIDSDAPNVDQPVYRYFLHMLTVNNNQEVMPYTPPAPPKNSGFHHYHILLAAQAKAIDLENLTWLATRHRFDLDLFIHKYGLTVIDKLYFRTTNH